MAVQALIYEVDPTYQPDGRLAVDSNADEACDIPDRGHAHVADGGIQPAQIIERTAPCRLPFLQWKLGRRRQGELTSYWC